LKKKKDGSHTNTKESYSSIKRKTIGKARKKIFLPKNFKKVKVEICI